MTEIKTQTLTEFLRARVAEDEAAATSRAQDAPIHEVGCFYYNNSISPHTWTADHCDCEPEAKARALAECEAKRHALKWANVLTERGDDLALRQAQEVVASMFRAMASVYTDHPDYRPEWRP